MAVAPEPCDYSSTRLMAVAPEPCDYSSTRIMAAAPEPCDYSSTRIMAVAPEPCDYSSTRLMAVAPEPCDYSSTRLMAVAPEPCDYSSTKATAVDPSIHSHESCDCAATKATVAPTSTAAPEPCDYSATKATHPQQPQNPGSPAPTQRCNMNSGEKVQCGTPDVTAEQCEAISCCFDGQQCYYARAVTVQCTKDGQFVVVVSRDSTVPELDLSSISLLAGKEASCQPAGSTSTFVVFQFPVSACGTVVTEEQGVVVYENFMSSSYEVGIGPRGSITRDSHFYLNFQCRYSATSVEALVLEVNKVPAPHPAIVAGPLQVELRLANGQCHSKGCAEEVKAYTSYYTTADYPVTKVIREPVYVEVRILGRTDPNIVLTLEHCWATNRPNPDYMPQWDLLIEGCPYRDDHYLSAVVPVDESSGLAYPTHYKRFIFKMFAWVFGETYAPEPDQVFIHCSTAVCHPSSTTSCEQRCHRKRRSVVSQRAALGQLVVSSGALVMTRPL
ncbi:zona pellucida sperm-binding protein 4-like [Aplochiton taeniatus]